MKRVGVAAAVLAAVAGVTAAVPLARAPHAGVVIPAHPMHFFEEATFRRALAEVSVRPPAPLTGARALIVPHHWLAGPLIVEGLRDLAAGVDVRRVILIGPNHNNVGGVAVATDEGPWETPRGRVDVDVPAMRALVRAGVAGRAPEVLTYEHSVAGLVPAIGALMPRARIVPLALRSNRELHAAQALARALAPLLRDPGTVLIASVDFSHYLSAPEAVARNVETLAALRAMDTGRILSFGNEHLDSPATIGAVLETMRLLGRHEFHLLANTNATAFGAPPAPPVTSYITGWF